MSSKVAKLIYVGKLEKRIVYLKSLSILSSAGLATSYSYVIGQQGFSMALGGLGVVFTPFLMSPFFISWFFKRYVLRLSYDPTTDCYTAKHFGLLLNRKTCTFKKEDVEKSEATSVLNSFKVGRKPFFLHDEDLTDADSVRLYKRMLGLDKIEKTKSE